MATPRTPNTSYKLNTYANGFGVWSCQVSFTPPLGNGPEASQLIAKAMDHAKRVIRHELLERSSGNLARLSYFVSSNRLLPTNQIAELVITEGVSNGNK
jgi:hypothetical protein